MKVVIVGQGNPYIKNPYLSKLSEVLKDEGVDFEHWVWSRGGDGSPESDVKILLKFGTWGGGVRNVFGYFLWMARLFFAVLRQDSSRVFFCSRFDAAFPCALASKFRSSNFVLLDRDRLSKSYPWPWLLKALIENVERRVAGSALLHVVPGQSRISGGNGKPNVRVVRNTPHSKVIARSKAMDVGLSRKEGTLRVLVSGLISPPRGAAMMLETARSVAGEELDIEFIAAGRLVGEDAEELAQLLGPNYFGEVSNETALALTLASDIVLAFYDPSLEINRLAEPNKWFDCCALGIPFITNHGLTTSAPFVETGACFVCQYGDSGELTSLLADLRADPSFLRRARENLEGMNYRPWDEAMSDVVRECRGLLGETVTS